MLHGCCTPCCTPRGTRSPGRDSFGLLARLLIGWRRFGEFAVSAGNFRLPVAPHRGPVDADGGANYLGRHAFAGHGRDLRATFLLVLVRALTAWFVKNDGASAPFTHGESDAEHWRDLGMSEAS